MARAARRVEEEAAARVGSFPVICARVEAETAVRVESLQARVNNKNGYQQKDAVNLSVRIFQEGFLVFV